MTVALKHSKLWQTERARSPGRPYSIFKLRDPSFFNVKNAHVYRVGDSWLWVFWDIAGHDHRMAGTIGWNTPEKAAVNMLDILLRDANLLVQRLHKLAEGLDS